MDVWTRHDADALDALMDANPHYQAWLRSAAGMAAIQQAQEFLRAELDAAVEAAIEAAPRTRMYRRRR